MKVVVTGGSGSAGGHIVSDLRVHGHHVTSVDLVRGDPTAGPTLATDLTDLGVAFEAVAGADAVVHFAAIPAWGIRTEAETWRNNMVSSYNVFTAAATLAIPRVIWASSETVYGFPFTRAAPAYVPMDEASPLRPETSYALSKVLLEATARYFAQQGSTAYLGMRLSNILGPSDYPRLRDYWDDPRLRSFNLWSYVDVRDVAAAVRGALTAQLSGAEVVSIHAADTVMTRASADLMAEVFPATEVRRPVLGTNSLVDTRRAAELLGWTPVHSWRDSVRRTDDA